MMVDSIERIALGDVHAFHRDYVRRSRPVVIESFLTPDAIARAREIGRSLVKPTAESQIVPARLFAEQTLVDLLAEMARSTVFMPTPAELRGVVGQQLDGLPFEQDMISEIWAGRAGGQTLFHYDLDMRANVLVQLFGHKRVAIADPEQTQKLEPFLHGDRPQFSSRSLTGHSERDRERFLAFIDAREVVLGPGEAIFIPALYWHQLDYVDTTLSVTFRLGRDQTQTWLASTVLRLWPEEVALMQGIAARCCGEEGPHPRLLELREAFEAACENAEHNTRFVELMHAFHAELYPGRFTRRFSERDAAYFEARRSVRRPSVSMTGSKHWESTSIPWLMPGYEVVEVLARSRDDVQFRIVSCANSVIARLSVPRELSKPIRELLRLVARRGSMTIDELADKVGLESAQLAELLRAWSRSEWLVDGRA
jgi:hypothetical protein